ncbi:MAG: hypothetical protein PHP42_13905 [Bacteroidota bacterium]|nr:hypothetical protein [Bacteroidota bacterium]
MKNGFLSFLMVALCFVLFTETSKAIPAFARKYKTSCATCHNGFPKLNAFGDAFRRNGYQFPGGTDPEFIKEEPVPLGSEGNKRAFPEAIWPGSIPGSSPISLFLNSEVDYNPHVNPSDPATASRISFDGLGNSIEAIAGGSLGEDISFWGQASLNSDGLELNRIFLTFSNLVGNSLGLNAKVGVIEPSLFSFSTHRAWMEGYWFTTRSFSSDMGWTIEETQKGIEVNGILNGRFGYSAGVVEGFGHIHADKDFYGHVTYKIGGLPLDGVVEGGAAPNNPQPYIDNSLTLGAFAYRGFSFFAPTDSVAQDNNMTMVGGDVNAYYERFNFFGGIGIRNDAQPFWGTPGKSASTTVWFGEVDVTVFPWLLPGIRLESWNSQTMNSSTGNADKYTDTQIVPGIVALVRPNVKATLRTSIAKLGLNSDKDFHFNQVMLMLAVGI